ncbi:hypothetical protein D3C78_1216720 [compost metagenome]
MQCRNLVVKRFSAFVETPAAVAEQALQELDVNFTAIFGQVRGIFQKVEHAPTVTVGSGHEHLEGFVTDPQLALAEATLFSQGTVDQLAQGHLVQTFEYIDPCAREQCIVQFERRVFGSGTNENQRAVFNVRQERVLL